MCSYPCFSLYLYLKIHPITMIKECQNQPHFTLIQNNEELAQVCQLARQQKCGALDTDLCGYRPIILN